MTQPFAFAGRPELQPVVEQALRRVVDPEMALNIVDLGLVYGVCVEGPHAQVDMTMTSPACPMAELIVQDVRHELARALGPAFDIDVVVGWDPAWTPERMSEHARRIMGWT